MRISPLKKKPVNDKNDSDQKWVQWFLTISVNVYCVHYSFRSHEKGQFYNDPIVVLLRVVRHSESSYNTQTIPTEVFSYQMQHVEAMYPLPVAVETSRSTARDTKATTWGNNGYLRILKDRLHHKDNLLASGMNPCLGRLYYSVVWWGLIVYKYGMKSRSGRLRVIRRQDDVRLRQIHFTDIRLRIHVNGCCMRRTIWYYWT